MAHRLNHHKSPKLQKLRSIVEYCSNSSIVLVAATVLIVIISMLFDRQGNFWPVTLMQILSHWKLLAFLLLGMVVGRASSLASGKGFRELTNHLWIPFKDPIFYLLGLTVSVSVIGFWVLVAPHQSARETVGFLQLFQHDPGGLFALFMALLTVVGFALTLQGLSEIRRTITSFSDLIDRLRKMLKSVTEEGEPVRMLCYTPALGYIALPEREFSSFAAAVKAGRPNDKPRAEMICLGRQELEEWHRLFIGRQTRRKQIDPEDRPAGIPVPQKSGEVTRLTADAATTRGENIVKTLKAGSDSADSVKRLPFEFMPGYYFFFTNDQAIIAAPLYLPFGRGTPKTIQKGLPPVADMIGFQTNDRGIINDLRLLYEVYQRLPSSYLAEKTQQISASEFESWGTTDNIKEIMDDLVKQFKIARGKKPAKLMTKDEEESAKARADSYSQYLRKDEWLKDTKLEILFRVMLVEEVPEEKRIESESPKKP